MPLYTIPINIGRFTKDGVTKFRFSRIICPVTILSTIVWRDNLFHLSISTKYVSHPLHHINAPCWAYIVSKLTLSKGLRFYGYAEDDYESKAPVSTESRSVLRTSMLLLDAKTSMRHLYTRICLSYKPGVCGSRFSSHASVVIKAV